MELHAIMGWSKKNASLGFSYALFVGLVIVGLVSGNIDQDKAECADQVVGMATCLPYVGGEAKLPTQDCCGGLKVVLQKSKKCLCILIKDRDDPSVGLKINLTLALGLPTVCHAPANISECVDLLHLPPNSREAKDFEGLKGSNGGNGTSSATTGVGGNSNKNGQNSDDKSGGGGGMRMKKTRLGIEILIWFFIMTSPSLLFTHTWW